MMCKKAERDLMLGAEAGRVEGLLGENANLQRPIDGRVGCGYSREVFPA